jgi:GT2 family glycosyltransferase
VDRIFDERFGAGTNIPAGEDTDYIYRAYLADVTIEYVPDMAVFHHHGRKSVTQAINLFRNARNRPQTGGTSGNLRKSLQCASSSGFIRGMSV